MTDTSHLEDKQTPEMVSDQIKEEAKGQPSPENPAPEQKPKEKPAEDNKPATDPKPEEKQEEKPEEKPDAPLQTKPRTIYDDYKDKKKEVKEKDSEIDVLKTQLSEKDRLIADLTEKAKLAETPAEKQEVEDEISQIAEKIGADPEGIKVLTEFLSKKLVKPVGVEISPEDLEAIKNFRESKNQQESKAQFTKEWNVFEPSLKAEFPSVSNEELEVIREVVDKLAHSPKYADKEVDYIYFKEKANLSKLISPKRPSYEGSNSDKTTPDGDTEVELSSKSTPMDAMKATSKQPSSGLEIRSGN
jgi:hypothetical protein